MQRLAISLYDEANGYIAIQSVEESKEETKGDVDPRQEEEACLLYMNTLLETN